ncbi:peptide deformylase [Denitrobaculum tricleocarpae]|uniref:Peptide deformylase n=1 Tax=Denitrobaculum tricleocarpae TaxID=2591009 RepID=A0A545TWV7_9PROT|nr:peptide deformylase [Denitrobaculum tricleocarpae]TQV81697.1 peptide deformylase [Denitrobaculum tricleocarpae]
MTLLKIARMGHPVLKQRAAEVEDPTAPEIRRLVADMIETMRDANGTGLAAPQVHMPLRVVVFFVNEGRAARENARENTGDDQGSDDIEADSGSGGVPLTVLINPELEFLTEEQSLGWEGCLSVPGLAGQVPRYTALRYSALDLEGQPFERVAKGFHARVVQHECDHLDGVLYPQRMTDLSSLTFTSEIGAAAEASGDGGSAD